MPAYSVNFMEADDAAKYLGGSYEFMGVSARAAELATRRDEMRALARALEKGLSALQSVKPEEITAAMPKQLMAGVDTGQLTDIITRYRASLYPPTAVLDVASCERVAEKSEVKAEQALDLSIANR